MSLIAHTIIPRQEAIVRASAPPKNDIPEAHSQESFKTLLQEKGLIDETYTLLYNPTKMPEISKKQGLKAILDEPIDYVFKDRPIPLTERSWLEKIRKEFPTIQFSLRGSRAARLIDILDQFEALLHSFAMAQNAPELLIAWDQIRKKIPPQPPPHDTDWVGSVKGLSSEKILNRLIHVMAEIADTTHDESHHHGFQEKAIAQVSRFVRSQGNFAIASIGKEKKADILIGKLKHPYLFQRDCFFIKWNPHEEPSICKRKYFWQAVVDRLFGIVRLEPRHADNFYCFLAAIELKTKGCILIEKEVTLHDLLVQFRDQPIELVADKIVKRIHNHHIDPFCYLFNLCSLFENRAELLWNALIPRFQHTPSTKFHPLSWKIYLIIDAHRMTFAQASHAIHHELLRTPGFLPLFPKNEPHPIPPLHPLALLFQKEANFVAIENRHAGALDAASQLFSMWIKGKLDPHDEKRLYHACHIPQGTQLECFRHLLKTDFRDAAFPFYLKMIEKLPPESLFNELNLVQRTTRYENLALEIAKRHLPKAQQIQLISERQIPLPEKLLTLIQEGHFDTFAELFSISHLQETEAARLLKALPQKLSEPMQWIKLQLEESLRQLTIDDILRESQRFQKRGDPQTKHLLETALNHIDWVSRPEIYPLIVHQGIKLDQPSIERLIAYVKEGTVLFKNHLLDALTLISISTSDQGLRELVDWIIQHPLFERKEGYLLWPFVLQSNYTDPQGLSQLVSPGKELQCFKCWVQLHQKNPSQQLRTALLMHLRDAPQCIVEITTHKTKRHAQRELETIVIPQLSDDVEVRKILLRIAETLVASKIGSFSGLELLLALSAHAHQEEQPPLISLSIMFIQSFTAKAGLPDRIIHILDNLAEHFEKWKPDPWLMHAFSYPSHASHRSPRMKGLATAWKLTLCESTEIDLTLDELIDVFDEALTARHEFLIRLFKSPQFQNKLTLEEKFEYLTEAIEWHSQYEKNASARFSLISQLLIASKCAFCAVIPEELQIRLYNILFKEMLLALKALNREDFQSIFYALLWFSSNQSLIDFTELSVLETGYFYLKTKLSDSELLMVDETAANYLQDLISKIKQPKSLDCFSHFLMDYLIHFIRLPRSNNKHDSLIETAVKLIDFVNVDPSKLKHFILQGIEQGHFPLGTWQRPFYLLLTGMPYLDVIEQAPANGQHQSILRMAILDHFAFLRKKPMLTPACIDQCHGMMHYMITCSYFMDQDEFFSAIHTFNHMIYQLVPLTEHAEGNKLIKMSLDLFIKYAKSIQQTDANAPIFQHMRSFLDKAKALKSLGPLPTNNNQKYNIIYIKPPQK